MNRRENRNLKISLAVFTSVFLISFACLTLQVTLTRIFSTTIWYHFAFMVISVALFGWAFGGVLLHFLKHKTSKVKVDLALTAILLFSISLPIYLITIVQSRLSQAYIGVYYLTSIVPFFLSGIFMAFFYSELTESVTKLYLADLAGASFGGLAVEPIISTFGAESTVLFLGVISSLVGILLAVSMKKRRTVGAAIILFMVTSTFLLFNVENGFINVMYGSNKSMFRLLQSRPDLKLGFTRWNSFSRVDAVEGFQGEQVAEIFIDADASTSVLKWDGNTESLQYLKDNMDILPYYLTENPQTLIIGPGGGRDVFFGLLGNSSKIVAVELNPLVIEAARKYSNETAFVYTHPKVELYIDEGRSFIRRSDRKFDVITITLVDSWAAISAGGYALAENYLYTKEAFIDYLDHLTDQGLIIMIRWNVEVPRLVATMTDALIALGEHPEAVGRHLAIIKYEMEQGVVKALLVLKKKPFTDMEAELLLNKTSSLGQCYSAFYIPYLKDDAEPYSKFLNGTITFQQYYDAFEYRVDVVTDNSPFHFNLENTLPWPLANITTLAIVLTSLAIIFPWIVSFWLKRKKLEKMNSLDSKQGLTAIFIVYFSALGLAYMLIEIAFIQKFILFLGYPTRALAVTLFSLLLSSGIGSFVSGQLSSEKGNIIKRTILACTLIVFIAIIYILTLPAIFDILLAAPSSTRIATTALLLFPIGFLMGIPFPSGLRLLHSSSKENIPWIWSANGATSVLGSIFSAILGIFSGFNQVILVGATIYFLALLCMLHLWKSQTSRVNP